jgi:hypothetical protein
MQPVPDMQATFEPGSAPGRKTALKEANRSARAGGKNRRRADFG